MRLPHVFGHGGDVLDEDVVAVPALALCALAQVEDLVAADVDVRGRGVSLHNLKGCICNWFKYGSDPKNSI